MVLSPAAFVAFNAVLMASALSDLRTMRIPNILPIVLAACAVVFAWPTDFAEFASRLGSGLIVAGVTLSLYLFRLVGGGDMKLLAASALWMPVGSLGHFAIFLGLASGVQGLIALGLSRAAKAAPRRGIPYALSIAVAGLAWSLMHLARS